MTNNDQLERILARHDPAPPDAWDPDQHQDLLASIVGEPVSTQFTARRTSFGWRPWAAVAGLGVAAATVVSLVLPAGSPGGPDPAAAAVLRHLAVVAGTHGTVVGEHQYGHVATHSGVARRDDWIAPSGTTWWTPDPTGAACLMSSAPAGDPAAGGYEDASTDQLDALPTNPDQLAAYIDDHPSGDNRGTVNRFIAVGDLLRSSLAPAPLRAAALRVLADTSGVSVDTSAHDARGRAATEITLGDDSLYFDPSTSQLLQETSGGFTTVVLESGPVDTLPDIPAC